MKVRDLMTGKSKFELTNWWHKLIQKRIEEFLEKKGYVPNVTPFEYLKDPPLNWEGVVSNNQLIDSIIKEHKERKGEVMEMVEWLKKEIYSKIDDFFLLVTQLLAFFLNCEGEVSGKNFGKEDTEFLHYVFKKKSQNFEKVERENIEKLFDDLNYLKEMRRLEENPQEKQLHIVPVGGLCLGKLVRIGSEMRTVIEVWGPKMKKN